MVVSNLCTEEYWTGRGPLFFYTGNEDSVDKFYKNSGFIFTLAKKFSALVVFAEHVSSAQLLFYSRFSLTV